MLIFAHTPMWRRPSARAVLTAKGWAVDPGEVTEPVLPADVARVDPDVLPVPIRLPESLHEVVMSLRAIRDVEEPGELALRTAEHYRRFGGLDLCVHGRPMWHWDRPLDPQAPGSSCISAGGEEPIATVVGFIESLDALVTGGDASAKGMELRAWTVDNLEPLLGQGDYARTIRAEAARPSGLTASRKRQLLGRAATGLLRDCGVAYSVVWDPRKVPVLALVSETSTGLYAFDVARTLGRSSPPPTYTCVECGAEVVRNRAPRSGEGVYCERLECRRARTRLNTQRSRARAKGDQHVQ